MNKKHYDIEREGQCDFFDNYQIDYQGDLSVLVDNTDGVYHGNILEFKCNISNTGKTLFQAIKYLSKLRVKGESVPARILLVDLNATKVYVYDSKDFIDDIQKVYIGAASKDNSSFQNDVTPKEILDYSNIVDSDKVKRLLINKVEDEKDWYIPVDLNEDCIVGWAERYYREIPKATKGDFLGDGTGKINLNGEIRDPKHFAGLINPYTEPTNEKFKYLMDCLNDRLNKKDLGAFYTPEPYCEKAAELVQLAVERVPEGNDYIILDRCAGTGNLEAALYGKYDKNGDELISHCVVSTYEYYEYKVLLERIGQDVRNIIPPTEANVVYENGKVSNADAMSKDYIDNPLIKQYIDNPKCTIILFENPPYRDENSMDGNNHTGKIQSYIRQTMATVIANNKNDYKDLANQFIWSAFRYYLRQSTDSYVVFSPIKYWKTANLCNKQIVEGFLFNRAGFHAQESAISCIFWKNEDDFTTSKINLTAIDLDMTERGIVSIKKAYKTLTELYDKTDDNTDIFDDSVYCDYSGEETTAKKLDARTRYNDNIIGCLDTPGFSMDPKQRHLTRVITYRGRGFYLRKNNYLFGLPLFVVKYYPIENWYEKDVYATSADGGDAYTKDKVLLKSCLIYTCLSNQNKCLSFTGSDKRYYRNELCFDTTHGETVASKDLKNMKLNNEERKLLELWNKILNEAKETKNYNSELTYGIYQISKELNTSHKEGKGKNETTVYDYPILNGYLTSLRDLLKDYYKKYITKKLFKYELLK